MQNLKISPYLKFIKRKNDYAVYHSLLGRLVIMNKSAFFYLRKLQKSSALKDAEIKTKNIKLNKFLSDLKERHFLVPADFDEYTYIKNDEKLRAKKAKSGYLVRGLQLIVSNTCNFRCKYCFVNDLYNSVERASLQTSPQNQMMKWKIAKMAMNKTLKLLQKNKHKTLTVEFFGGEPLTNWPLVKKTIKYYKNKKYGIKIIYTITTNGSLITDEMAKIFKEYKVAVVISFDSPKNTERVSADGRNVLSLIEKKLKYLKQNSNWVAFNSTLSKETLPKYDGVALINFAKENGIAMIGLILDLDLKFYQLKNNRDSVLKKLWLTYTYARKNGLAIAGYWHQIFNQIIGKQALNLNSGYKTCPATGCKISVEPAGHIFICKCCSGYMGRIQNLQKALASSKYHEYAMRAYRNAPQCQGCEIENFCSGVCMGALEKKYGHTNIIEKSSCEIFKNITRKLIMNLNKNEAPNLNL